MGKNKLMSSLCERALGCLFTAGLALVLCISTPSLLWADTRDFDTTLTGYITRMFLALFILGAVGYAAIKFLPGKFRVGAQGRLKLVGALNLGRDVVYLVRVGPDVIALFAGKTGSTVLGRWSAEEWDDYEAALPEGTRNVSSNQDSR